MPFYFSTRARPHAHTPARAHTYTRTRTVRQVVGSVAALAATPAAEVRVMILDLSENMQPEAFKAFVVRIASALPPGVHKGLASRFARQVTATTCTDS